MGLERMGIDLLGIASVLATNSIRVPVYQRPYAWEAQHVTDLFQDVANAILESESEYFLGSIVASETGSQADPYEVVDGQQRLATSAILIAAIRDYFYNKNDDRSEDIENKYLTVKNMWSQERSPRIRLSEKDHDFFEKRVLSKPDSEDRKVAPRRESHKKIATAADIARAHVERLVNIGSRPTAQLRALMEYLDQHAKVIWVTVPDHANAFVIFETLNDRGLDLAVSDLLKNLLFLNSEDRLPETQQSWVSMFAVLESAGLESSVVDYIRHLWSSQHGATRESRLYGSIKAEITSKQKALNLAVELEDRVSLYVAMLNHDHPFWKDLGSTARGHMRTINMLRMGQIRPLLLAVLHEFNHTQVKLTLRMMVSWGVRFLIVGGLGGGTLEKRYAEAAVKVRRGEISNAQQLSDHMASVVPADSQFEDAFATTSASYAYLSRYYLRVLEQEARGETEPELVPNPNEEEVNLEHVLPQNPSDTWDAIDPDLARVLSRRLGNLCLLKTEVNSLVANDSFLKKKEHLASSEFVLTAQLGEYDEWGRDEIDRRQRHLAKLAIRAWPLGVAE